MIDDVWVVQGTMNDPYALDMLKALSDLQLNVQLIHIPMFSVELPRRPLEKHVVFYGATTTTAAASIDETWSDTVWYDKEKFRWSNYAKTWGNHMLNKNWCLVDFETLPSDDEVPVFVRPDYDLKEFEGHVTTTHQLGSWGQRLAAIAEDNPSVCVDTPIILAPVLEIAREWRSFIVDGAIVSTSRYRSYGKLDIVRECPQDVWQFISTATNKFEPADVFVIDVGALADGQLGIIEINCFNSSGWYDADIHAVIDAINHRISK